MNITIVICTHNRRELLAKTLDSVNRARRPAAHGVEILVVANACRDDTHDFLDRYTAEMTERGWVPLRWAVEAAPGKSRALNTAFTLLDNELIAFVDDDHRIDEQYLNEVSAAFRDHAEVTMFCGRVLPDWDGWEPAWAHDEGPYAIYPLPVPRFDLGAEMREIGLEGPLAGGGNLFIRRGVYERTGEFARELGPHGHDLGGGEDSDFVARALAGGERLFYIPRVVQYHYVDPERFRLGYLLRKSYQRSRSVTRVRSAARAWPPRYMWRKLTGYAWSAITSLYWPEIRFYLVRAAATVGEIDAYMRRGKDGP